LHPNLLFQQAYAFTNWLGPRGEALYFLHKPDRIDFATYAGGDPIRRSMTDGGRVYIGFSRPNLYWICTSIISARQTFQNADVRFLTKIDNEKLKSLCAPENDQSTDDRTYVTKHWHIQTQSLRQTIAIDYGMRFQCKLALGFGQTMFGSQFASLEYELTLRKALWERDALKRQSHPVLGTSLFTDPHEFDEQLLGYPGAFTFVFMRLEGATVVAVYLPSRRSFKTVIVPKGVNLSGSLFEEFGNGFLVLLIPGLRQHIGPIRIERY
jgi:hypothetical protein